MPPKPRRKVKIRSGATRQAGPSRRGSSTDANPTREAIQSIDWDDLSKLFGSRTVARGESYHEQGRVSDLRWTKDNRLVAAVRGSGDYETVLELGGHGALVATCTCPVGSYCKHAVAVVLAFLDAAVAGDEVRVVDSVRSPGVRVGRGSTPRGLDDPGREVIREWLRAQDKGELIDLLVRSFEVSKPVRDELCTAYRLDSGQGSATIVDSETEIDSLTSEDVWYDGGREEIPDYSGLELRFKALREAGMYDALLDLGVRLFDRGSRQLDQAHDHGEIGMAIMSCLDVAFGTLGRSERSVVDQLLLAFDLVHRDGHGIVPKAVHSFLDRRHNIRTWSEVADRLRDQLGPAGDMRDFSARYRRRQRVQQVVLALDRSRRAAAATELLRDQAEVTLDWVLLVDRLLALRDLDAADAAAIEGLTMLPEDQTVERAGLRDRLRQIAERRGDHGRVAAFRAEEFFRTPSLESFLEALGAARQAGCEARVRSWMEHFLRTGRCPVAAGFERRRGDPAAWPLPASGELVTVRWSVINGIRLLRDVAIREQKPAIVLRFHDRLRREQGGQRAWYGIDDGDLRVADAVAAEYPGRAIEIYMTHVHRLLARADTKVYALAVSLLGKVGNLMGGKRIAEWKALLSGLRQQHARKRSFIAALDRMTRSPLEVARQRRSGRR